MARTKLDLPEHLGFRTELSVRITDVNYAGHLANDAVLSLIHEARILMLKANGFTEGDVIVVEVGIQNIDATGCDFYYKLTNKASGKEVARAKTGIAFFDFTDRKVSRTPEKFKFLFGD